MILSWVRGYIIPFKSEPFQGPTHSVNLQSHIILTECINELQKSNFISPCNPCAEQIISPIFTVPKPNNKHRFILNLKHLNKFIQLDHFKMEDYRTVLKLLDRDYYMASLDLKDAYFLISVDKESRKKLRFQWRNILYEFNVLPFGLCTAPFVFTKLLKPILQYLRSSGFLSVAYLDDILCIGKSYEECISNINTTKNLLQSLGFVINTTKSNLVPSNICQYLGFVFNSIDMTISLPNEKRQRILDRINACLKVKKCTIRYFAELIGLLTSACPAVRYGWLYTKLFEREKYLALANTDNYNKKILLPSSIHNDLNWWKRNIMSSCSPISTNNFHIKIFSDASETGWGVACTNQSSHGNWTLSDMSYHINALELKAAFYGLRIFASNLRDCDILLRIDNTTAICYINRMGGVQHPHLNQLAREIWQWCEVRNIYIFASYIKSEDNTVADRESRKLKIDTEWELSNNIFSKIIKSFGQPEFDLFASSQNFKCHRFASWKLDPLSEVVDAFTFDWRNIYFYAFPPFSIITKVLQKIKVEKAEGILIVPNWPSQPWYPLWLSLVVSQKLYFGPDKYLLYSPFRQCHPLHADLILVAAKLSGRR